MEDSLLDTDELVALARLDFEKERFDQALIRLKQAVEREDASHEAWSLLGATYARLRLWGRARKALETFLSKHPDALNERFQLGMTYVDAGDPGQALSIFQEVLKREPIHPPALYYSALSNARLGRLAVALTLCEQVMSTSASDNLFNGRAKELAEKLQSDLQRTKSVGGGMPPSTSKTSH